jgi:gamma-glutamyl-gamma-aminobutyrate hydrolase PuuD
MKPRIGVTSAPSIHDQRRVEHLDRAYTDAVVGAGAFPFVLPVQDGADAEEVLSSLDGLLLTGGGTWLPPAMERTPHPRPMASMLPATPGNWRSWRRPGRPAYRFSGCVGASRCSTWRAGGTLIQHLPVGTDASHKQYERGGETVHAVEVDPGSLLAAITGQRAFGVNTLHHQAVADVGSGLRPVAWAPTESSRRWRATRNVPSSASSGIRS